MGKLKAEHKLQLKCDNPKCGYIQNIPVEKDVSKYVDTKCPTCGEIILTLADYKKHLRFVKIARFFLNLVPQIQTKKGELALYLTHEKKQDGNHRVSICFDKGKMIRFNPENKVTLTYGEALKPVMAIRDKAEAQKYLRDYAAFIQQYLDKEPDPKGRTAIQIARGNIGYFAGYYDSETRGRIQELFDTEHPIGEGGK